MSATDQPRWIPVSSLPLDLLAAIRDPTTAEVRIHRESRSNKLPAIAHWIGWIALIVAVFNAIVLPESFLEPWPRAYIIVLGAVYLALRFTWRRALGFAAEGGQSLVLGPASLVIVDRAGVQVHPAESLEVHADGTVVTPDGEPVHKTLFNSWSEQARRVIAVAKTDPSLRASDRWRIVAATFAPSTPAPSLGALRLAARAPLFIAVAAAVASGAYLYAGPLHSRAAGIVEARHRAELDESQRARLASAEAVRRLREQEDTSRRARAELRQQRLANALTMDMITARSFLAMERDVTPEERARVNAHIREQCPTQFPVPADARGRDRILRVALQSVCADPDLRFRFQSGASIVDDTAAAELLCDAIEMLSGELGMRLEISTALVDPGATGVPYARIAARAAGATHDNRDIYDPTRIERSVPYAYTTALFDAQGQPVADGEFRARGSMVWDRRESFDERGRRTWTDEPRRMEEPASGAE